MTIALIDNGSLEPAAHLALRAVAAGIEEHTGERVQALSWKHSSRIDAGALNGVPAPTLAPWIREQVRDGESEFLFIPFFVSDQGAIGSALRSDLDALREETGGFTYQFTTGLASQQALVPIVCDRIRAVLGGRKGLPVIVVDHGGPSLRSATLRDRVAAEVAQALGSEVGRVRAASMEGDAHPFNRPLFSEALSDPSLEAGPVVVAPLFMAPGRHAGPKGDLVREARAAEALRPGLRCEFTNLVGSHERATRALAQALRDSLPLPLIV